MVASHRPDHWKAVEATPEQRANYEIIGDGQGIHWSEIDEDISAEGMLCSIPAQRPLKSSKESKKD